LVTQQKGRGQATVVVIKRVMLVVGLNIFFVPVVVGLQTKILILLTLLILPQL